VIPRFGLLRRIRNLHIFPEHHDALPVVVLPDLVYLDADQGLLPHPQNLLTQRRESIQPVVIEAKIDRHDVWPVVASARDSAEADACEQFPAFLASHLGDQHLRLERIRVVAGLQTGRLCSKLLVVAIFSPISLSQNV